MDYSKAYSQVPKKDERLYVIYQLDSLVRLGYTDSDFQSNKDSRKSTSTYVFTLGGEAISSSSIKQFYIVDSTMEVEYMEASKATKEAV